MNSVNDAGQPSADAAYPITWECDAKTLDGVTYRIRPIRVEDEELERRFIMGLSPDSRYKRMMCFMREPSPQLLHRFVHVDYRKDMAFVALTGEATDEQIIGVARYARDTSNSDSEFAVVVADQWQGRGVGAMLTRLLFKYAREQGIHKLHGDILASNKQMIDLVHWLGMDTRISRDDAGMIEAERVP